MLVQLQIIEEYDLAHKQIIPRVPIDWINFQPNYKTNAKYTNIYNFLTSKYEEDRYFIEFILTRADELNLTDEAHMKRIDDECGEIWAVSE